MPGKERYPPPKDLDKKSAALWVEFMDAMPAGWFGRETFVILAMLCRLVTIEQKIADKIDKAISGLDFDDDDDLKEMKVFSGLLERHTRIVAHLAGQLHLTPKSRCEHRKKDVSDAPSTNSQRRPWDDDA